MDLDVLPYLSSAILVATTATIVLAFLSYLVFRLRERKRRVSRSDELVFFRRYYPEAEPAEPEVDNG